MWNSFYFDLLHMIFYHQKRMVIEKPSNHPYLITNYYFYLLKFLHTFLKTTLLRKYSSEENILIPS